MGYIDKSTGRVVWGDDNRTAPVTKPTPAPTQSTPSQPSSFTPLASTQSSSPSSFAPLGTNQTSNQLNSGSYTYAPGSAAGPLNYNQQQQAQNTGSAYIPPATGGGTIPITQPIIQPTPQPGLMTYDEFLKLYNQQQPKVPDHSADTSTLIQQLLSLQKQGYTFDPNTDAALKQAQTQSMNRVKQDMVASGRLYSSYTDTQQQQAAQGLIPQYQQLADQRQNNQFNNTLQTLNAIQNVDNTTYNKSQDQIKNDATYAGTYNGTLTPDAQTKASTIAKNTADINETARKNSLDAADKEATRTGYYIDPKVKSTLSAPIPTQYAQQVQQYSNDFAGAINTLYKQNPSDPLIPILEAARYQKVMSDPTLREKYMSDYYTQTLEGKKSATDIQGKQLDNIIKQTEAEIALATAPAKAEKILLEVDKVKQDIQKGNVDIQEGIARINDIRVQTQLRPISVSIAQQNANTSAYNAETSRTNSGISQTNSDRAQSEFDYKKEQDANNPKASASFNEIYSNAGKMVTGMGKNSQYLTKPGSVENKQFTTLIANAIHNKQITASEGEIIFNTYNVPY